MKLFAFGVSLLIFVLGYLAGFNSGWNSGYELVEKHGVELKIVQCPTESTSCEYKHQSR